jgi:hypothetical protein
LSWRLAAKDAAARGLRQTAYRLLASSSPEKLARDEGDLWDSGDVVSEQSVHVVYAGRPLGSGAECCWKVRVRDQAGAVSAWSRPARWTMGLLEPGDWTAQWIGAPVPARAATAKRAGPKGTVPFSSDENRDSPRKQLRLLNLFAYTGASTLAAAGAGAEVVHVDAARNMVAWARRNAELSGLAAAPIRWIAEDALKFVKRELRRGNHYDAVILDPPSYGHGPRGEVWRLSKHLPRLLSLCGELTAGRCRFMLLTCHTPEFDARRLERLVRETWCGVQPGQIRAELLVLRTAAGRELPSGIAVYWEP